ncbi:MAG: hypothetical protein HOP28_17210 [Gemmatimonadales bacterium]|nr:hypothetical protein [Gemmatimonadales bacterium]
MHREHGEISLPGIPATPLRQGARQLAARLIHARGFGSVELVHELIRRTLERVAEDQEIRTADEAEALLLKAAVQWLRSAGPEAARALGGVTPQACGELALRLSQEETPGREERGVQTQHLLYLCAHPAVTPEGQHALLLRLGMWLPPAVVARLLGTGAGSIPLRIRRAARRLRAVRRPTLTLDADGAQELSSRTIAVLELLWSILRYAAPFRQGDRRLFDVLTAEALAFARVLADARSPGSSEAHALLAYWHLGRARRARAAPPSDENPERSMRDGLTHLRAAELGGGTSRFIWLARLQEVYLLAPNSDELDWRRLTQLYERLLPLDGGEAASEPLGE